MNDDIDVLVVGAGTAGIPCAVAAAQAGASVLLVDKADDIGGSLHVSTAQMSAGGSRRQRRRGILDDSPERHVRDIFRINHDTGREDLIRLAATLAVETVDALDDQGIDWAPDCPQVLYFHEPYDVARTVWGARGGVSLLDIVRDDLEAATRSAAVELWLRAEVRQLLVGADGVVRGVELDRDGERARVEAATTVLATGGYAASPNHFAEFHGQPLYSGAWHAATGDGIDLARQVGGQVVGAEHWMPGFGCLPGADEEWRVAWRERSSLVTQMREQWEIYVARDGRRFVAEDCESIHAKEQALGALPDATFFQVFDARIVREAPQILMTHANEEIPVLAGSRRGVFSAPDLTTLAVAAGIDAQGLEASVAAYNDAMARGAGDELGRRFLPAPIAEAPFYALENHALTIVSFGGIDVDGELRVRGDDGPVPGLYAVGEVLGAGALMGNAHCGGMLVTPAISLGRWLGRRLGGRIAADRTELPVGSGGTR